MQGWVSIHRSLRHNWVWSEKPYSKGQAWVDLLLMASYKDTTFLLGNELISIERGSFITSEVKLAEQWGWSRTKVRAFLQLLEQDKMIQKKSDSRKTALTIVNYNDYQDLETTKEQEKNSEKTAKEQGKNTINNINNNNKDIYMDFVELTETEYNTLLEKLGADREDYINRLNNYIGQIGIKEAKKKYKSHYHVILNWHRKDVSNGANKQRTIPTNAKDEKDEIAKRAGVVSL